MHAFAVVKETGDVIVWSCFIPKERQLAELKSFAEEPIIRFAQTAESVFPNEKTLSSHRGATKITKEPILKFLRLHEWKIVSSRKVTFFFLFAPRNQN